jgi:hypothetical protein
MRLQIRLLGVLQELKGLKETFVDIPEKSTVGFAVREIIKDNTRLMELLWDNQVNSPSPNALLILDGIEVNNLNGIETVIEPDQELVILSVVHGG